LDLRTKKETFADPFYVAINCFSVL